MGVAWDARLPVLNSGHPKRLFFALWPAAELAAEAARLTHQLLPGGGNNVPLSKLHITLAFLGSVATAQQRCVELAASALQVPEFQFCLDTLGVWRRSGVAWLSPSSTPEPLLELAQGLASLAAGCGLPRDPRPYRAHLTLKRKFNHSLPVRSIPPLDWPVREFALVVSRPGARGPAYHVLRRWPMG